MCKVYNHKGKLHLESKLHATKTCFSIEAYEQITVASCNNNQK